MNALTPDLERRNRVRTVRLAQHTTMRVGGPATLVTLRHRDDIAELAGRGARWLGKGANLVVGEEGVVEPVVRLGEPFAGIELPGPHGEPVVRAGAACDLAKLVQATARAGLAGLEGLAGVPATVGGALAMNAGTAHRWLFDVVRAVEVVLPGEDAPRWLERQAVPAAYRTCGLPRGTVFLACELSCERDDPAAVWERAVTFRRAKAASQPLAARSAGCIFKNPAADLPAGRLIDEIGGKGLAVGDAVVSEVHANFIVNRGAATAADVCALIGRIRRRAWRGRSVALAVEVETWSCPPEVHVHPSELGDG